MKTFIIYFLVSFLLVAAGQSHKTLDFQQKLDLLGYFHHGQLPKQSKIQQGNSFEEVFVGFIDQKLDHFNISDTRTFKQARI